MGNKAMDAGVCKKLFKLVYDQFQRVLVLVGRLLGWIDFPVPPNSSMRKTSSRSIRHYYISGVQSCIPIATAALQKNVALRSSIKVLDFGCGVGRQLLQFQRCFPQPKYYACDVDDTSIAFIRKAYPKVQASVNSFEPPLDYADGTFDMVYSVSIFSHLNMADQRKWLDEMARITRPTGYCFLTIEGMHALRKMTDVFGKSLDALQSELEKDGYLYREYEKIQEILMTQDVLKTTSLLRGIGGSYGNTVLSKGFIRENWNSESFEVTDILEGIIDDRQDLVVLYRK